MPDIPFLECDASGFSEPTSQRSQPVTQNKQHNRRHFVANPRLTRNIKNLLETLPNVLCSGRGK